MRILISPKFAKKVALAMLLTALILAIVSFTSQLITAQLGFKPLVQFISAISSLKIPASRELARDMVGIVHVNNEQNIPTWFSASVLLLNSVLLAAISSAKRALGDKYAAHWWGLSAIFLALSLDEIAGFHDRVSLLGSAVFRTSGVFTYFWVIPGIAVVLFFLLVYLRFFFDLPTRVKWLFLGAVALYVGGALGLEMVGGYMVSETDSIAWLFFGLKATAEEFLEMSGALVFFYALTGYCEESLMGRTNAQLPSSD